jgi:A/G-specific adenine glycosylase
MRPVYPDFAQKLTAWQRLHGRHGLPWQDTRDPYRIWVSEIMLQQTQVGAVIGYFERFMGRFPNVRALARASEDEVLKYWSGLGYYARARNLRKAAGEISKNHNGIFPSTAKELEALPGIGRSTAAAIAAFSFGENVAILDGNVKRVLARHFGVEGFPGARNVEGKLWDLANGLLPKKSSASAVSAYTQGLMDLGATICTRTAPACGKCPLASDCVARKAGRTADLPASRPRKDYPTREMTWLVIKSNGRVLLERRPSPGIWGGLWSFPELVGSDLAEYSRSEFGYALSSQRTLTPFAHSFTHFRLQISSLVCTVKKDGRLTTSPSRTWMGIAAAIEAAIPVPVRKVLNLL